MGWSGGSSELPGPRRESVPEDLPGSMNKHAMRHSGLLMEAAVSEEAALRGHLEPDLSGGIAGYQTDLLHVRREA